MRTGLLCQAVTGCGIRLERLEQVPGGALDRLNGGLEGRRVGPGRILESADLAHELQGGSPDLVRGGGRFKIVKGLDVPAHSLGLALYRPAGSWIRRGSAVRSLRRAFSSKGTGFFILISSCIVSSFKPRQQFGVHLFWFADAQAMGDHVV